VAEVFTVFAIGGLAVDVLISTPLTAQQLLIMFSTAQIPFR
jgi:hypothetical protein